MRMWWQALLAFMQVCGNGKSAEQFQTTGPVVPILWLSMSVMMPVCGPAGTAGTRRMSASKWGARDLRSSRCVLVQPYTHGTWGTAVRRWRDLGSTTTWGPTRHVLCTLVHGILELNPQQDVGTVEHSRHYCQLGVPEHRKARCTGILAT